MPVLHSESKSSTTTATESRIRKALIQETEALVRLAKREGVSLAGLPIAGLSKLELMLLDTAFKQLPLEKADTTLLILPDRYNDMLQKIIVVLVQMIQDKI